MTAETDAHWFVSKGCEYYATARWAVYAGRNWVSGDLFHHAVEMLLKAGLRKKGRTLSELQKMRHNLKALWREFKQVFPNANLAKHDKTISLLNKFEDIRYPKPAVIKSMGVSVQWSGQPPKAISRGGKTSKQFTLIVSDIDALVADVIKAASWNAGVVMGKNSIGYSIALTAIRRHNRARPRNRRRRAPARSETAFLRRERGGNVACRCLRRHSSRCRYCRNRASARDLPRSNPP
jgi:hypothetical protein